MICDVLNTFADNTSVAAAASTALIGNQIPLGTARDLGGSAVAPAQLWLVIKTTTEIITGGNAGTIEFQLVSDASAAIAIDGSATVHLSTGPIVTDDAAVNSPLLNVGAVIFCAPLPVQGNVYEAYLGILAIIGTTTVTAGAIDAYLTPTPPIMKKYPNAI